MVHPGASAAWRHEGARDGFEVVFAAPNGYRFEGQCTAVEDGEPWSVGYVIEVGHAGLTLGAQIRELSRGASTMVGLEHDGHGHWRVNGVSATALEGCLDVDLEASAFTNALPFRRLALDVGERGVSPAAWVRSPGQAVERLDQSYVRLSDSEGRRRFAYEAPRLGFAAELCFDDRGLGLDYPGLAVRVL